MRNNIKSLFIETKIPMDDRHKYLFERLVILFDSEVKKIREELFIEIFESYVLENKHSGKIIDFEGEFVVRNRGQLDGKKYNTLMKALNSLI